MLQKSANIWYIPKDNNSEDTILLPLALFLKNRVNVISFDKVSIKENKLIVVAYLLYFLKLFQNFQIDKDQFKSEKNGKKTSGLKHVFVVIDEAQNFAPEFANSPLERTLGNIIMQIAAEGRKYGLHLILATQRPNKVKKGLLGECDNAIILKMNSRADLEHIANEMRILDIKLLEPCLHFQGQGNAIAVGEMTKMAPYMQMFKSAPRRTVEGGVDIEGF